MYFRKPSQMKNNKAITKSSLPIILKVKIEIIHLIMYKYINNFFFEIIWYYKNRKKIIVQKVHRVISAKFNVWIFFQMVSSSK